MTRYGVPLVLASLLACAAAPDASEGPSLRDGAGGPAVGGRAESAPEAEQTVVGIVPATRTAYLDADGVVRWRDSGEEVRLFGANYALPTAGDYRAAGRLTPDRKGLIDQDMAHFARMGWDGLRVAFWGDWQAADLQGNLLHNEHLDLMHYLVAAARERGIYILFNPIHTYNAGWPDAMEDSFPGFAAHTPKSELGTDPAAIAAQVNYVRQILEAVNPYTGVPLAEEPSILFVEMINEPHHHPEDVQQSVAYMNALHDAVREAGSDAITFHNVSQDFRIAPALVSSRVQGASFGWYPTGLNTGSELVGNHLRSVDDYPPMRLPILEGVPKVVYEFDSADQVTATMYPAMARAYRAGGIQFASMFAYDMLATASRNLGWQTHHLNLVYSPRKAMSGVLAAEAMRRLPRLQDFGPYPENLAFGDFRLDPEDDVAVLAAEDAYINAGRTDVAPPAPESLRRVAGYGPSPVVRYPGEGVYFLDRVREGVWRLEVYPDAVPVADPFTPPSLDRIVTRAIFRSWPMTVELPDLGSRFHVQPLVAGNAEPSTARPARGAGVGQDSGAVDAAGRFDVRPGVYILSAAGPVDPATLPPTVGRVGLREWIVPDPDPLPVRVVMDPPPQHVAGRPLRLEARVVTDTPPEAVDLWIRPGGAGWWRSVPMARVGPYRYAATLPAAAVPEGPHRVRITVSQADRATTFPGAVSGRPDDWDFSGAAPWTIMSVSASTPLRLFDPATDVDRLSFSRIGDGWREGIFRLVPSGRTGEPALRLVLPVDVDGITPEDYRTSIPVVDRIGSRGETVLGATGIRVVLRGVGPAQRLHLTLVERDGTGWSAPVRVGPEWAEVVVPLDSFAMGRAANLPQGFPGHWNYWLDPPPERVAAGGAVRVDEVERLQLSLRREDAPADVGPGSFGAEVESVTVVFR